MMRAGLDGRIQGMSETQGNGGAVATSERGAAPSSFGPWACPDMFRTVLRRSDADLAFQDEMRRG